jgi:hypothetical protein
MDEKTKASINRVVGILAVGVALAGGYWVFTYKPRPRIPEPKIEQFRADGRPKEGATKPGEPQQWDVQLVWDVSNVADVTIEPGIGKTDPKGDRHMDIDKTTTFELKAKNESGEITHSLEVSVLPPEKQ